MLSRCSSRGWPVVVVMDGDVPHELGGSGLLMEFGLLGEGYTLWDRGVWAPAAARLTRMWRLPPDESIICIASACDSPAQDFPLMETSSSFSFSPPRHALLRLRTFDTRRGKLFSAPPCSLKPQGPSPDKVMMIWSSLPMLVCSVLKA